MGTAFAVLHAHPRLVAFLGALSGWASVDFLRAAQVTAAILAATVSACALVLTAPKALAEVESWPSRLRRRIRGPRPPLD